jgi:hypothetical protein
VNAIRQNADQLIENKSISLDSRAPAIGQAKQIVATGGKFITAISRPLTGSPRNVLGEPPEKKIPALRARRRKPKTR